ncbi:hypothetical protein BGZ76_004964, partial [Entomortierella beljakovae]
KMKNLNATSSSRSDLVIKLNQPVTEASKSSMTIKLKQNIFSKGIQKLLKLNSRAMLFSWKPWLGTPKPATFMLRCYDGPSTI